MLKAGFAVATTAIFALFLLLTAGVVLAPQQLRLKTDKALVAAARTALPNAPLYAVGRRSYSAEFYSNGRVRAVDADSLAQLAGRAEAAAFSLPPAMAADAEGLGLENMGEYGRHVLFITPRGDEVK